MQHAPNTQGSLFVGSSPTKTDFKPASPFVPKDHQSAGEKVSMYRRRSGPMPPPLSLSSSQSLLNLNSASSASSLLGDPKRPSTPSCQALRGAVSTLYRIDDFHREKIGAGFFSEVFKVTHKSSGKVMVLKMNKQKSNRNNMLKEVQLLNKLSHPNILRFLAACVHEGQLHALTEFINHGSLEQLIQRRHEALPWSLRISLALDVAKGIAYLHSKGMFHRDLTSKNILIKRSPSSGNLTAVVADFGLAAKIPKSTDHRLPQVGSPYWMSPECLRGKFYDEKADIFSYGIILCEIIGRLDADPDVLPRTENFGVDYIAFSKKCSDCPPDFLKLAFRCVGIEPKSRPSAKDLANELEGLLESQRRLETRQHFEGKITLKFVGHKRSLTTEEEIMRRSTPSEKARFHHRTQLSVMSIGKEMSLRDPHYKPTCMNPFATLPRLREGKKIFGSSRDLFSSCFELPSPSRGSTPTASCGSQSTGGPVFMLTTAKKPEKAYRSLPSSPTSHSRRNSIDDENEEVIINFDPSNLSTPKGYLKQSSSTSKFEDHLFQGRVQLLKRIYSGGTWITQDDSAVQMSASSIGQSRGQAVMAASHYSGQSHQPLRRRGSCESGFYSVDTEDFQLESGMSSTRSLGSSLLTVSDLEEDLRAASAFLSNQRTSSTFTDSTEDLFSEGGLESSSGSGGQAGIIGASGGECGKEYEKDIRDIVEYFEASCKARSSTKGIVSRSAVAPRVPYRPSVRRFWTQHKGQDGMQAPHLQRSQKIDSLIKRVVEKESRDRFRNKVHISPAFTGGASGSQRLQICDGIVRSKLPIFDHTKMPYCKRLQLDHKGIVKSKLALFDSSQEVELGHSSKSSEKAPVPREDKSVS